MSRRMLLPVTLLAIGLLTGCGGREQAPNILLISMDTTRADHLSAYGYGIETSPFLEEFAAEGALFR